MTHAHHEVTSAVETPVVRETTLDEVKYTITVPYREGHVLTAEEAFALNGLFAENVSNNVRAAVRREAEVKEGKTPRKFSVEEIGEMLAETATTYKFGLRRARGQSAQDVDPIRRIGVEIAVNIIKAKLREAGKVLKAVDPDKLRAAAVKLFEGNEAIQAEAARRHAVSTNIGELALSDLDKAA